MGRHRAGMDNSRAGRDGTGAAILYDPDDDASGDSGHTGAAIHYADDYAAGDAGSADRIYSCGTDCYAGAAGDGAVGAATGRVPGDGDVATVFAGSRSVLYGHG